MSKLAPWPLRRLRGASAAIPVPVPRSRSAERLKAQIHSQVSITGESSRGAGHLPTSLHPLFPLLSHWQVDKAYLRTLHFTGTLSIRTSSNPPFATPMANTGPTCVTEEPIWTSFKPAAETFSELSTFRDRKAHIPSRIANLSTPRQHTGVQRQ